MITNNHSWSLGSTPNKSPFSSGLFICSHPPSDLCRPDSNPRSSLLLYPVACLLPWLSPLSSAHLFRALLRLFVATIPLPFLQKPRKKPSNSSSFLEPQKNFEL